MYPSKKIAILSFAIVLVVGLNQPTFASRIDGSRAYFTDVSSTTLNLYKDYPEIPTKSQIDERISTTSYNNVSSPGLLFRALPNLFAAGFKQTGLIGMFNDPVNGNSYNYCSSITSPECSKSTTLAFQLSFVPCLSAAQTDCISRFAVKKGDGTTEEAQPLTPITPLADSKVVAGNKKYNLPSGGTPYIWTFPTYAHRGGKLFMPQVSITNYGQPFNSANLEKLAFQDSEFQVSVTPYSASQDKAITPQAIDQSSYRLMPDTFLSEDAFIVEFRSSTPWMSWVRSSITDLTINSKQSGEDFIYSVSGRPARVPNIAQLIPWTATNIEKLRSIDEGGVTVGRQCDGNTKDDPYKCWTPLDVGGKANIDLYFQMFAAVEPFTNLKSTFSPERWVAADVPAFKKVYGTWAIPAGPTSAACINGYKGISPMGVTSTNATLATDGPPSWNPVDSSLNYKLAALPKLSDGTPFVGNYTLQIPMDIAKCLWGANAANANATISVLNADGVNQVTTASASHTSDYFRFVVGGFHFSSPKIVIKLTSANSTTKPSAAAQVVTKLVCVNGKLSKVVTGIKPTCPTGYSAKK